MKESKSSQSTTFDNLDNNLMQCIDKMKEENQYLRKALMTAENLIKNYQEENNKLIMQIKILQCKLRQVEYKYHEVQKNFEKQQQKRNTQNLFYKKSQKQKQRIIQQLNQTIRKLIEIQQNYEQKIQKMEHKIVLLERNNNQMTLLKKKNLNYDIGLEKTNTMKKKNCQNEKKSKNFTQLRAFHLKLQHKDLQIDKTTERQKSKKGIVQTVFSLQKLRESGSLKTIYSQKKGCYYQKNKT